MTAPFTRADYERLPEGFPAQLVGGELVKEPSPGYGHQSVSSVLHLLLASVVGPHRAICAPQDVGIDEWNVYQPDLLVLRDIPPPEVSDVGIPLIAFEILSPSTAGRDRGIKRRRMLEAGVAEVWLVDPKARTVEVHDANGRRSASGEESLASRALPGLAIVPARLFAPAR